MKVLFAYYSDEKIILLGKIDEFSEEGLENAVSGLDCRIVGGAELFIDDRDENNIPIAPGDFLFRYNKEKKQYVPIRREKILSDIGLTPKQMNAFVKLGIHPYSKLCDVVAKYTYVDLIQTSGIAEGAINKIIEALEDCLTLPVGWAAHKYARKTRKK